MPALGNLERLLIATAFLFHIVQRYGWIVYALNAPAPVVSLLLLRGGKPWSLWLGGFLYLVWSVFGYLVELLRGIERRNARRRRILIPPQCVSGSIPTSERLRH